MKYLLIILSVLLLSSSVNGESKTSETFYEWKNSSGIQWSKIGDKDFHAKFKGDVVIGDLMVLVLWFSLTAISMLVIS